MTLFSVDHAPAITYNTGSLFAGIAQLVERNLAKVEVGSSRLLSRSRFWETKKILVRARLFVAFKLNLRVSYFDKRVIEGRWESEEPVLP